MKAGRRMLLLSIAAGAATLEAACSRTAGSTSAQTTSVAKPIGGDAGMPQEATARQRRFPPGAMGKVSAPLDGDPDPNSVTP